MSMDMACLLREPSLGPLLGINLSLTIFIGSIESINLSTIFIEPSMKINLLRDNGPI